MSEIRHSLALLGDLLSPIPRRHPDYFDEDLYRALAHFQQRNGLKPDSI